MLQGSSVLDVFRSSFIWDTSRPDRDQRKKKHFDPSLRLRGNQEKVVSNEEVGLE